MSGYESPVVETTLLKPVAKSTVPARTKPFNAAAFYQTRDGLYVYDTFANRFDLNARQKPVGSAPERSYVASLLKASAIDTDIRKELPETHLSTLEDIADLIVVAQQGDKPSFLPKNSWASMFYVEGKNEAVFVVRVGWDSGRHRWYVYDWELDGYGKWRAGNQILCPGKMF